MNQVLKATGLVWLLTSGVALAPQTAPDARPAMEATLQAGLSGRWWTSPRIANRLGLTFDQQKKMDAIFQQNRPNLIDLTAALDREEAMLEPLMEADQPDATNIRSQIDRIVKARSALAMQTCCWESGWFLHPANGRTCAETSRDQGACKAEDQVSVEWRRPVGLPFPESCTDWRAV